MHKTSIISLITLVLFACSQHDHLEIEFVSQWGSEGSGPGQFNQPIGVALDAKGNVYVSDAGNNRIQKFTTPILHRI